MIETEEFVGRFSFGSRFPQYLLSLVGYKKVRGGRALLDHCDVDRCSCAGLEYW